MQFHLNAYGVSNQVGGRQGLLNRNLDGLDARELAQDGFGHGIGQAFDRLELVVNPYPDRKFANRRVVHRVLNPIRLWSAPFHFE